VKLVAMETLRPAVQPNLLLLRLHADDGAAGLGEAFFGAAAVEAYLHDTVAPVLAGATGPTPEGAARLLAPYVGYQGGGVETRGNGAVDLALWDLLGQRAGLPVVDLLGGAVRDRVIMVELHGLWNRPAATRILRALAPFRPAWVEDPLRPDAVEALARLAADADVPIATGETCVGRRGFLPLLERGAVDVVTVDVGWTGGLTEARKVATLADAYGVPVAPHDCTGPIALGELTLAYEGLELVTEPGLTLTIYTAEPGSPSAEALRLLASWAASQETDSDPQTLSAERRHA
jgi:L-alanine-DL-glutamate epimerase-like enolase superfamily enzyme